MNRTSLATRLLRRWHKQLGLLAAAFFAYLALTGLFLNHSELVDPDSTPINAPWLMTWYGLKTEVPANGFRVDGLLFVASDEVWVWSGKALKPGHGQALGAARNADQLWIATNSELDLFQIDGHLVERIERDFLPAFPLRRLGTLDGRLIVETGRGAFSTTDGIAWVPLTVGAKVSWSRIQPLSDAEKTSLEPLFAPALTLERIIADVHSGRIFGRYGMLVTDALAASLLLLVGSGIWMYFKSPRGRRRQFGHARHHDSKKP